MRVNENISFRGVFTIPSTPFDEQLEVDWEGLRSKYYEQMGWDRKTGKPLPDTLRHFGLEHTIPELWGR